MNTILLATTVIALTVAAVAVMTMYLAFNRDRRRSEARVAALRQMAGVRDPALDPDPAGEIEITEDGVQDSSRAMFSRAPEASPWARRALAAAATALIVTVGAYAWLPRGTATEAGRQPATPAQAQAPLELLKLQHAQEDGRLVITGLVQNPRTSAPLTKVITTAFLFGPDGTLLASGKAPLDFSVLAAGDESPFLVTVPVKKAVARYRIGFRSDDGRVIAHVDRRAAGTLARTQN